MQAGRQYKPVKDNDYGTHDALRLRELQRLCQAAGQGDPFPEHDFRDFGPGHKFFFDMDTTSHEEQAMNFAAAKVIGRDMAYGEHETLSEVDSQQLRSLAAQLHGEHLGMSGPVCIQITK